MEEGKMKEGRCRSHLRRCERRVRMAMVVESTLSLGESSITEYDGDVKHEASVLRTYTLSLSLIRIPY